ncbi:STOP family protein [Theileria parva strain Muguga]|uniref:STOP family protein n=1 Tax=Theileria parva strain Muguga TaxID=333668 RepID=UPI001C6213C7|nr:STOP family protein [Theileria parva strain Muguga]KAF5153232.1 STOP family protein [Theileria parva strain Muguga]
MDNFKNQEKICKLVRKREIKDSIGECANKEDENEILKEIEKNEVKENEQNVEKKEKGTRLEYITTYSQDYKIIEIPKPEPKQKIEEKEPTPFEGITTYTLDYSLNAWKNFENLT